MHFLSPLVFVLLGVTSAAPKCKTVMQNPGFENGLQDWTFTGSPKANATIVDDNANPDGGKYAAALNLPKNDKAMNVNATLSQAFQFCHTGGWNVQFSMKQPVGANGQFNVILLDETTEIESEVTMVSSTPPNNTWTTFGPAKFHGIQGNQYELSIQYINNDMKNGVTVEIDDVLWSYAKK